MKEVNLLLGITGSVATIKLPEIVESLRSLAAERQLTLQVRRYLYPLLLLHFAP